MSNEIDLKNLENYILIILNINFIKIENQYSLRQTIFVFK